MTEGKIAEDGKSVIYNQPIMDGVVCEVQHSVQSEKPFCPEHGLVGVGVVTLPTGQPRVVLQIKHADGTSLSATLTDPIGMALLECIADGMDEAQRIADAAPHIKVLRLLAISFRVNSDDVSNQGALLERLALIYDQAADALEAADRELAERIDGAPLTVHYDPKGKPPPIGQASDERPKLESVLAGPASSAEPASPTPEGMRLQGLRSRALRAARARLHRKPAQADRMKHEKQPRPRGLPRLQRHD